MDVPIELKESHKKLLLDQLGVRVPGIPGKPQHV